MDYFELVKGFLLSPVETFKTVRDTDLGNSLKYYLILLAINAVMSALMSLAMTSVVWTTFSPIFTQAGIPLPAVTGAGVIGFALMMIILQFVLVFIGAAWLHIFVWLLGGRNGYLQTLKAIIFGSTPAMLFGWIPFIGVLAGLWSLVLGIFGLQELQNMTTLKAVLAIFLSVMIVILIAIVAASFFMIAYSESGPIPVTGP
jgi:hypothetical protein